jgi:hypothetical protein
MPAIYAGNVIAAITRSTQDARPEPNGVVLVLDHLADLGLAHCRLVALPALAAHRGKDAVVRTAFLATLPRR